MDNEIKIKVPEGLVNPSYMGQAVKITLLLPEKEFEQVKATLIHGKRRSIQAFTKQAIASRKFFILLNCIQARSKPLLTALNARERAKARTRSSLLICFIPALNKGEKLCRTASVLQGRVRSARSSFTRQRKPCGISAGANPSRQTSALPRKRQDITATNPKSIL